MVNSFYDPVLGEGCALEELISFHGGMGGLRTRPFILHPAALAAPGEPMMGAAAVHGLLLGWRESLQGGARCGRVDWSPPPGAARQPGSRDGGRHRSW